MDRRTVVFLGAGASVPHGFPTTDGILPRIWEGLNDGSWRGWPGLRGKRAAAARAAELRDLLRVLLPGLGKSRRFAGGASIVDVISLLDQLIGEGRSPFPKLSEDRIRRSRGMLQIAINSVLRGTKRPALRDGLVDWLLSESVSGKQSRVTLVSTNYDTVVEQEIFNRLVDLRASVGRSVDFGIPWRDTFRDILHVRPRSCRLAVYKLHGSLNWLRCETCGHVSINVRQRIATLEFWQEVRQYNECHCGGRLRSVVVTPSVVRDIRDANLLSIWNAALEDLRRAHEWILIGYSLPSEDIAIRSLLLRAYHTRTRPSGLRIRVVQREPADQAARGASVERLRYRAFFPESHLRERDYLTGGVEPFVASCPAPPRDLRSRLRRGFPPASRRSLMDG
jgi:NAD-dependent SIR2 family protein deacetylase